MTRFPPALASIVAAIFAAGPVAGQEPGDSSTLAGSYHAFAFALGRTGDAGEQDLLFTAGRAYLAGPRGQWMLRAEAATGVSFYGSVRDMGYLLGAQLGIVRTWTGDYLRIAVRTELYAVVGGGAYVGWNMEETPQERRVIPVLSAGFGLRFRRERELGTFAVLREQRIGAWASRLILKVGVHVPRSGRRP